MPPVSRPALEVRKNPWANPRVVYLVTRLRCAAVGRAARLVFAVWHTEVLNARSPSPILRLILGKGVSMANRMEAQNELEEKADDL